MKVDKMSISMTPDLGDEVREAAASQGLSVSAWLASAAQSRLRSLALESFLDDWEERNGALSVEELQRAERELALSSAKPGAGSPPS